jgi:hypothetical protein
MHKRPVTHPFSATALSMCRVASQLGSAVYVAIELGRSGSPTVIPKLLILALLIGGAAVGTSGLMLMGSSPGCHLSSPIVYNWTLAAVLAFCIFTGSPDPCQTFLLALHLICNPPVHPSVPHRSS